jgi:hypothetical protein
VCSAALCTGPCVGASCSCEREKLRWTWVAMQDARHKGQPCSQVLVCPTVARRVPCSTTTQPCSNAFAMWQSLICNKLSGHVHDALLCCHCCTGYVSIYLTSGVPACWEPCCTAAAVHSLCTPASNRPALLCIVLARVVLRTCHLDTCHDDW